MSSWRILPGPVRGTLEIPTSKSHTLRAILFALFGRGTSVVYKYLHSTDAKAMIEAIQQFGAKVTQFPDRLEIVGVGNRLQQADDVVQSGNSGQVLRFIGAIAGLLPTYTVITGDASIRHNRPVIPLLDALKELGVMAESTRLNGCAPIIVRGPMVGGRTRMNGQDSQPVSGMLIAASFAESKTAVEVAEPGEKPWIDLTLHWFDRLGIQYNKDHNYCHYEIPGKASYPGFHYTVPADFSSCAYPLVAAIITDSEILLQNIDMTDVQGDKELINVLISMGAKIDIDQENRTLQVKKGSKLIGKTIDINDFIDSITILAVVGCFAEGKTEIVNAAIARKKECDRIKSITTELRKMGAKISEMNDGLVIEKSRLTGAELETYHDHRMVLSLSVAALAAEGASVIRGVECVKKTYPNFFEQMKEIGVKIEEL